MNNVQDDTPGRELVNNIVETQDTLDQKIDRSEVQIFSNTKPIVSTEFAQRYAHDSSNLFICVVYLFNDVHYKH